MIRRWRRLVWLAMALPACGDDAPASNSPWPPCGAAPGLRMFGTVPAGDAAFVVYAHECPEKMLPGDVRITDSSGSVVGVQLEPLEDSAQLLVRTESALVPGSYRVVTPDGRSQSLTVTEATALPTTLGELTVKSQSNCEVKLDLALDESALAYASLLGWSHHVIPGWPTDNDTIRSWESPGQLEVESGHIEVNASLTRPAGQYTAELVGYIAGYDTQMVPARVMMDWCCAVK